MNHPNLPAYVKRPWLLTIIQTTVLIFISVILLVGCSHWPKAGSGGFAEHSAAPHYPIEVGINGGLSHKGISKNRAKKNSIIKLNNNVKYVNRSVINNAQGLRIDSQVQRNTLNTLILQGAKQCFPAAVHNASLRQNRIERELTGGLIYDASLNIQQQHFALHILRQQVDTINPKGFAHTARCIKPLLGAEQMAAQATQSKNKNNHLLNLLNSDNQFAVGSSALNPKYAARLAKASHTLKNMTQLQLVITGHTDATGHKHNNHKLAQKRAQNVAKFLNELGINNSRISINAVAEAMPYSNSNGDEHYLVNRRVTIDFIDANSAAITFEH